MAVATKKIQVLLFMSEIKFDLTIKRITFSVSFMLSFTIIKLFTYCSTLTSGNELFSSYFASIWSCSACVRNIILGKKSGQNARNRHCESAVVSDNPSDVACRKRYVSVINDKTFNPEFIEKSVFTNSENKNRNFTSDHQW